MLGTKKMLIRLGKEDNIRIELSANIKRLTIKIVIHIVNAS